MSRTSFETSSQTASRTIVVTGASRGVGRSLVEHFLARGDVVYGISRSGLDLSADGYHDLRADVGREEEVREAFATVARAGELDAVVHAAAVRSSSSILLATAASAESTLRTNVVGTLLVFREAGKLLRRLKRGRIVALSSMTVPLADVGSAVYGASKAAMTQISAVAARELADVDVTVNVVGISVFDGGMAEGLPDRARAELEARLLKPATVAAEELASAVEFFLSPLASGITNQIVWFGGVR